MKYIMGALAAIMLTGVVFAQPAEARCFWNGFAWNCFHGGYHHHWGDGPYWRHGYYRGW